MNTSARTQLCYHLGRMSKVPSRICSGVGVVDDVIKNVKFVQIVLDTEIKKIMISKVCGDDVIKNFQPKNSNKMSTC